MTRLASLRRWAGRWAVVLATSALLAACSLLPASGADDDAAAADANPGRKGATITADGFMPDWIDGLTIVRNASEDPDCPWATAYPEVPNAEPLTKALRDEVESYELATRRGGTGPRRDDCVEPKGFTGLHLSFDFLIASGDVVGVRLTFQDAETLSEFTKSYWYDGRTREVTGAPSLLADSALSEAAEGIRGVLSRKPNAEPGMAEVALSPENREETLNDLSFDGTGALHARFGLGIVALGAAGKQEAVIPREDVAPWLSDLGRRAQEEALRPQARLTLPGAATRTAEPRVTDRPAASGSVPRDVDCRAVKCIALTFDDGPGRYTAGLLDALREHSARATFFVLGQDVVAHPELVQAEFAAGHEIGNHSWSHPQLPKLTPAAIARQLSRTDEAIREATGETPTLFRPPYGLLDDAVREAADRPVVLWNHDTQDWKIRDAEKIAANVVEAARPGDIVLMHDIHATSVQAVPRILEELGGRGFRFVTVGELVGDRELEPGRSYFSAAS